MSVECTTCGHVIPAGQFRCGKCGALAPRESLEDFGGLTEVLADSQSPALPSAEALPVERELPPAPVAPVPTPMRPAPSTSQPTPVSAAPPSERKSQEIAIATVAAAAADSSQQIETVPKGTFASETPHMPFPSRLTPPAETKASASVIREAVVAPQQSATVRGAASTSSQRVKTLVAPHKPPFLASQILREDLVPLTPGSGALFAATQIAGGVGLVGTLLVSHARIYGILAAVACLALIVLGRWPLEYGKRAAAVAGLSGLALTAATTMRFALGGSRDGPLLALACALLPGALLFRSWYRGAPLARALVGATLVLAFAWAAMTSHRGLLTLEFSWQSWLPALAWYLFCILCLLSLLAFMGDETTGGCGAWSLGLCIWFGLFVGLRLAGELDGGSADVVATRIARSDAQAGLSFYALGVAEAAFAAPFSVAIAQLIARAFVSRHRTVVAAS